jgi:hypothetical protein
MVTYNPDTPPERQVQSSSQRWRLDMSPCFAVQERPDSLVADPVLFGQCSTSMPTLPRPVACSYFQHLSLGKFRRVNIGPLGETVCMDAPSAALSARCSATFCGLPHVHSMGLRGEMLLFNTSRVITARATVANLKPIWNRPVLDDPSKTMRIDTVSTDIEDAVPTVVDGALPNQTAAFPLRLCGEALQVVRDVDAPAGSPLSASRRTEGQAVAERACQHSTMQARYGNLRSRHGSLRVATPRTVSAVAGTIRCRDYTRLADSTRSNRWSTHAI